MWCKLFGHNLKEYRNIECVEVLNIIRETTTVKCNRCGKVQKKYEITIQFNEVS